MMQEERLERQEGKGGVQGEMSEKYLQGNKIIFEQCLFQSLKKTFQQGKRQNKNQ